MNLKKYQSNQQSAISTNFLFSFLLVTLDKATQSTNANFLLKETRKANAKKNDKQRRQERRFKNNQVENLDCDNLENYMPIKIYSTRVDSRHALEYQQKFA